MKLSDGTLTSELRASIVIWKQSFFPIGMEPPVMTPMLKSAGGDAAESFEGGVPGAPSPMAADELEGLDGPILKPLTSAELVGKRVAKQAASRSKELVWLEDIADVNSIATELATEN